MSYRAHWASAEDLIVSSQPPGFTIAGYDEPTEQQCIVLDDAGNMEAFVVYGSKALLTAAVEQLRQAVAALDDPPVNRSVLQRYLDEFGAGGSDWQDGINPEHAFLLVEKNVKGSEPPNWLTTHESPEDAARYHDGQEYAEEWEIVELVDLRTGATFSAETSFTSAFTPKRETS